MQVPWANCLIVSSCVVFALVVSQVLLTWVPLDIVHILCNFVKNPKLSHQMPSLTFARIVCNYNGRCVIAMDLRFWLRMSQFFQGHLKNHALIAVEEEGAKFGFGGRSHDES